MNCYSRFRKLQNAEIYLDLLANTFSHLGMPTACSMQNVFLVTLKFLAAPQLKRLVAGFPSRRPGFDPGSGQVGSVVDKVVLGQVFSEYFSFPRQSSFHQLLHIHPHLSSGAGTIGQKWPQYKGLSPTPLAIKKIIP
jgi:hypothetical protein